MPNFQKTNKLFYLILTFLIILAYSNSFNNSFQYDDLHVIERNPYIKNLDNLLNFFWSPKMGSGMAQETSSYRPLFLVTIAINYYLGGLNVFGYHLVNLLFHTLSAIWVYLITLFFLSQRNNEEKASSPKNQFTALFAALIFAVHPIQTESVTYIVGRSSSLTGFLFLAAFWTYAQYSVTGKLWQIFLSSLCYVCTLLVKETAITLVLILVCFNLLFSLGRTWQKRLFSLSPYFIISAIYLMMRVHFFGSLKYGSQPIRPIYDNLLTQIRAWVHSLGTLVFPLNLNVDYDFRISQSILEREVLFSIFILTLIGVVIWRVSKKFRPVGFFAFWFAVTLAPTSTIIPLEDVMTDRWLYLPSVGFAVILAFSVEWLYRTKVVTKSRAWKLVFLFLCALVVELYGFATILRNFTWTSDWTLWEDAATKSPHKARPHIALGLALNEAGHQEEAIREFKKAMQLDPKDGRGYLNLGLIYFNKGWFEESIQVTQKALSLSPRLASEGYNNIGLAYMKQGRRQEAMQELLKAIQARPINAGPYFNLGNLYSEEGNWHKATSCMEKVIELEPEFYLAHEALSRLYEKKGWKERSQEAYKKYLKYAPPFKKSPPTP